MFGSGIRRIGKYRTAMGAVLVMLAISPTIAQAEPPNVTIVSPSSGTLIKERPTTISGTTSDTTDMVTLVVFQEGSIVSNESTMPQSGVWTMHPTLSDGTYSAIAQQTEAISLETGFSTETMFTLDATPPNLTLKSVNSPTSDSTPSFGGKAGEGAGEASPDEPVRVEVLAGATVVAEESSVAVSAGAWSYTVPSALADGTYTINASQQDQAGNKTEKSATFLVDATAPQVSLVALPSVLGTSTASFEGGSGTALGDAGTVKLTIFAGTAAEGTVVGHLEASASSGSWGATMKSLEDGTYTAIAEQLDWAGNRGLSAASTFTVKTKGPAVSLDPLASYTNNSLPSFAGSLGTAQHDLPGVILEIYKGTAALEKAIVTLEATHSGATWTATAVDSLADGTYTAIAKQRDEAKNVGKSIARTFTVDTQAPQPTLSAPPESIGLETVSGSAGTAPGDRRQVTAELFSGAAAEGGAIEAITVLDTPAGTWSATFAGLGAGQYTVLARQSDEAGNAGSSAPQTFTVNAPPPPSAPAAPTPPVASFTWVPAAPIVGQSVSFVSKSTDASSPITGYGWDMTGGGAFAAGGPLMTTTFATAGAHTVRMQVSDANGLSSMVAETVNVAPLVLPLMQPFPIVRIAGAETSNGARIRLLTV